jgi:hypothetical protein
VPGAAEKIEALTYRFVAGVSPLLTRIFLAEDRMAANIGYLTMELWLAATHAPRNHSY